MVMPACDPNLLPLKDPFTFGLGRGPFTVHENCFLKRNILQYSMNYTKQFFDTYKDVRKFFTFRVIDTHEFTGELGNLVVDPILENLMTYLDENGHLNNTLVYFYSDHGDHINPLGYKTISGKTERFNPFFFMILPDHLNKKYGDKVKTNTQRMTVADDIFETNLEYLGFKRQYKYGESLFNTEIPSNRTCASAYLYDPKGQCFCQPKSVN